MTLTAKRMMSTLLASFATFVVCVAALELVGWLMRGTDRPPVSNRYYLMSGSNGVFRNVDGIFVYKPHSTITSRVWFENRGGFANEYSYQFRTNNLGLVQTTDVDPGKQSLLVLGDSFTEGTGSPPWFDDFSRRFADVGLQPVNGGLLGTGFLNWVRLDKYLRNQGLTASKVLVVFISDDMSRKQWNFQGGILQCLEDWLSCEGWENYYGLPPLDQERAFLAKIKAFREQARVVDGNLRESLKRILPTTAEKYRGLIRLFSRRAGRASVDHLISTYGERVAFVHIPQKHEVEEGYDHDGVLSQQTIREAGATLYDGRMMCGLTAEDYFPIDQHLNAQGSQKLSECLLRVYEQWTAAVRQ